MNKIVEQTVTNYFRRLAEGFEFNAEGSDDGMANFAAELADLYKMVDMGLPSGTMWAKWNLGADRDNPGGNFYQWASAKPVEPEKADFASTPYCIDPTDSKPFGFSKYTKTDLLTSLRPEDDAAAAFCNGWSVPSVEDFRELMSFTTRELVEDFHGLGTGWLFTAVNRLADGSLNQLFFPECGAMMPNDHLNDAAACWTSDLYKSNNTDAYACYCIFSEYALRNNNIGSRVAAMPIRAVHKRKD